MERYGGELPRGADPLTDDVWGLDDDVLAFSHGRAALSWYLDHHEDIVWAIHCAYTCPTVTEFLDRRNLDRQAFDIGASESDVADVAAALSGNGLILVPALFGREPWLNALGLGQLCGSNAHVIIDAAQTAFGHVDYAPASNGAVLCCPRKACALGSGALLRMNPPPTDAEHKSVEALPEATKPAADKRRAREMFQSGTPEAEQEALRLVERSEATWPDAPHRMDRTDLEYFRTCDPQQHRERRRENAKRLRACLARDGMDGLEFPGAHAGERGVPFNLPVLLPRSVDRQNLLAALRARRVFATALWPDCEVDAKRCPVAADYRDRLVALPVDQRFAPEDMDEIGLRFMSCLLN